MKYVCDEMLKKLARWLRIIGYDVVSPSGVEDRELARKSMDEGRILLTRDKDLANMRDVDSLLIRSKELEDQLEEVFQSFPPDDHPPKKTRCPVCNGDLEVINKDSIKKFEEGREIPPKVFEKQRIFFKCKECGKYYWVGKHWEKIKMVLNRYSLDPLKTLIQTGT